MMLVRDIVKNTLRLKCSNRSYYDNIIYKYLYDFELDNYPSIREGVELNSKPNNIEIIDINDDATKSKN